MRGPRYLEDGEPIQSDAYASPANRQDRHHIFPRHHLLHHGFDANDFNAIPNVCLLVARENQHIGARAPYRYLRELLPKAARARRAALQSHLLPTDSKSPIWSRDTKRAFPKFLEERAHAIADAFEAEAGMALFRRR